MPKLCESECRIDVAHAVVKANGIVLNEPRMWNARRTDQLSALGRNPLVIGQDCAAAIRSDDLVIVKANDASQSVSAAMAISTSSAKSLCSIFNDLQTISVSNLEYPWVYRASKKMDGDDGGNGAAGIFINASPPVGCWPSGTLEVSLQLVCANAKRSIHEVRDSPAITNSVSSSSESESWDQYFIIGFYTACQ